MITLQSLITTLSDPGLTLPLLGSLITGALIGSEREFSGKPAGLRTHTLVCFASALVTLAGLRMADWTVALPGSAQIVSDMARLPHAVLTGIGFLGAGVIFREGATVHGLTTAASLWLTSALGIVFGTGLMELAVLGTLGALLVLGLMRVFQRNAAPGQPWQLSLTFASDEAPLTAALRSQLMATGWRVGPFGLHLGAETCRYETEILPPSSRADPSALLAVLQDGPGLREVTLLPPR